MTTSPFTVPDDKPAKDIVAFYLGRRADSKGRSIEQIWQWNNQELEYTHDYIQWLFPLKSKSGFNPHAPVLDDEVIQAFRASKPLRMRLRRSLEVMLKFYGLRGEEDESAIIEIIKSDEYQNRKSNWIRRGNHNYLRLTRILKSLKLLGLEDYAQALFKCLDKIYEEEDQNIESETYIYWKNAVG